MAQVLLKKLKITNFGPITADEVILEPFTYFVGRNNAGKSHFLRAIEVLLAPKTLKQEEMIPLQNDKTQAISIEGHFHGVGQFTSLVTKSNHRDAIDGAIVDDVLRVVRVLDPTNSDNTKFGIRNAADEIVNPVGFAGNLLKVLPDPISIFATADTVDELGSRGNTALGKLKKEVLGSFFERLREETQTAFVGLDTLLHSSEEGRRAPELIDFENNLREEFTGEFADVVPSVEFALPDEQVIAKEMKIYLDDGYRSEVEQKGHGLQRATLLALLRLLAKHGQRYTHRPPALFLIGELETFLHPYAQRQLAEALHTLVERYQVLTSTHSPFIISGKYIEGYRRVSKTPTGTKNVAPDLEGIDRNAIQQQLQWRGNMEGLFADRIILVEGPHDEGIFDRLCEIFNIERPAKKFTLFVRTLGKKQLRVVRKFYMRMGFDDVSIIADLDYVFCRDMKRLLEEVSLDPGVVDKFLNYISWSEETDPKLSHILERIGQVGYPDGFDELLGSLKERRVFVLRHGAPEQYYRHRPGEKAGWISVETREDIENADFLEEMLKEIMA